MTVDREACVEAGRRAAATDWQGGYRTEATRDAAEGVVRALVGRDPTDVRIAADAYQQAFREHIARGGPERPPRVRYKPTPYPW